MPIQNCNFRTLEATRTALKTFTATCSDEFKDMSMEYLTIMTNQMDIVSCF